MNIDHQGELKEHHVDDEEKNLLTEYFNDLLSVYVTPNLIMILTEKIPPKLDQVAVRNLIAMLKRNQPR
jgi:hypothetical protein